MLRTVAFVCVFFFYTNVWSAFVWFSLAPKVFYIIRLIWCLLFTKTFSTQMSKDIFNHFRCTAAALGITWLRNSLETLSLSPWIQPTHSLKDEISIELFMKNFLFIEWFFQSPLCNLMWTRARAHAPQNIIGSSRCCHCSLLLLSQIKIEQTITNCRRKTLKKVLRLLLGFFLVWRHHNLLRTSNKSCETWNGIRLLLLFSRHAPSMYERKCLYKRKMQFNQNNYERWLGLVGFGWGVCLCVMWLIHLFFISNGVTFDFDEIL